MELDFYEYVKETVRPSKHAKLDRKALDRIDYLNRCVRLLEKGLIESENAKADIHIKDFCEETLNYSLGLLKCYIELLEEGYNDQEIFPAYLETIRLVSKHLITKHI